MKKTLCIATLVCLVTLSFAFMKDTTPKYENLKVLPKNTTKQQLDSIMKHFSMSLGVKCTYCHVRGNGEKRDFDFASDSSNHKLAARFMMKMTNKINKKYFKEDIEANHDDNMIQTVTCFTCHNGKEHPENKPPAPEPRH